MKLTKVEAGSMQEALRKIRSTLGDDALIVGTRSFRRGGVLGVGGREVVEVYVADGRPPRGQASGGTAAAVAPPPPAVSIGSGSSRHGGPMAPPCPPPKAEEMDALSKALTDLREEVRTLIREKEEIPDHPFLRDAYSLLLSRDVSPKLAGRIVGQLKGLPLPMGLPESSRVRAVVSAQLRKLFLPNVGLPPARPKVFVLIGPTGVGKTTTIAKLAARAKLTDGRKTALITLDTFRIAAVDQLAKYAEIIGIPLAVASDPVEFGAALKEFTREDTDVIFVDSAGRSQRDELKMAELKEFLGSVPGSEVHLVLSATTQPRTLKSVVEKFGSLGIHRVILTKLDEASSFGALLEPLVEIGKPISYLTDGQNVPDDIMASDPDRLADLVLRTTNG
jgi:flagellar biosynthesis protein FlhF